jgi:hypothetical protein
MKEFLFIISLCVFSFSNAQETTSGVEKLKKDDLLIDAFVGYPNWGVYNLDVFLQNSNQLGAVNQNISTSGVVPVGIRGEYMLSNEISFTFDASYTKWSADWRYSDDSFDSLSVPIPEAVGFDNSFEASRVAIQIGMNYHIPDLSSEELDLYGGFAIGTNQLNSSLAQEQNGFTNQTVRDQDYFLSNSFPLSSAVLAGTPVSARFRVGGRYFFKPNLAFNAEIGTGIRTITFGLTFKL